MAAGAGAVLALASDIRLMADTAKFAFLFTKVGLTGADMGAAWLLPKIIGSGRAMELLLLGDKRVGLGGFEGKGPLPRGVGARQQIGTLVAARPQRRAGISESQQSPGIGAIRGQQRRLAELADRIGILVVQRLIQRAAGILDQHPGRGRGRISIGE